MRAVPIIPFLFVISATPLAFLSCNGNTPPAAPESPQANADSLILVTAERIPIAQARMALCIRPPDIGPHEVPEILVYANPAAIEYRRRNPSKFDYPIGSKFVKVKFSAPGQAKPDAATEMIRKGTRGDISDWEFTSLLLPDRTPLGSANDESCIDCHQGFVERGFISRESEEALRRYLNFE